MRVLAVDTLQSQLSLTLTKVRGAKSLKPTFLVEGSFCEKRAGGHAEVLHTTTKTFLEKSGVTPHMLDALCVTTGPGNFTSIRIGIAYMSGLSLSIRKPLVGLSSLEAMAFYLRAKYMAKTLSGQKKKSSTQQCLFVPLIEARRRQAYGQILTQDFHVVEAPSLRTYEAWAEILQRYQQQAQCLVIDRQSFADADAEDVMLKPLDSSLLLLLSNIERGSDCLARLAFERYKSSITASFRSHKKLIDSWPDPLYLRPPDARLPIKRAF